MQSIFSRFLLVLLALGMTTLLWAQEKYSPELPANTWVRIADCPGDEEGREVPPGRGSTWVYCPPLKGFLRYGGYTPRFSNAIDFFDPATKKWTRLFGEDENYPSDRPEGVCEAMIAWDEVRKCVWIAGGVNTTNRNSRGIWKLDLSNPILNSEKQWDAKSLKFEKVGETNKKCRIAFDKKKGVFVVSPPALSDGSAPGVTQIFHVDSKKWEDKVSKLPMPQEYYGSNYRSVYDEKLEKVVCVGFMNIAPKGSPSSYAVTVWAFDVDSGNWEKQEIENGPAVRSIYALAYDLSVGQIVFYGGSSDGASFEGTSKAERVWNDTWYLSIADKKWIEIKTPGPELLKSPRGGNVFVTELTYRFGLTYDYNRQCMAMMDPDHGVWLFKYVAGAEPGKECISGGAIPKIGEAAKNPPSPGPKEIRKKFPSELNPNLVGLPDNTLIKLKGTLIGDEIAWGYDRDAGVFLKYGGCGNNSNPYWNHYGNDLMIYDPGTETSYWRRVSDVSGGTRPGNGCTRVPTYDAKRKVTWFFGGVGSGPYMADASVLPPGFFQYNLEKDLFTHVPFKNNPDREISQNCFMIWLNDFDCAVYPMEKNNVVLDFASSSVLVKPSTDTPGRVSAYERMTYLASKKVVLRIAPVASGKTSPTKPAEALELKDVVGKSNTYWIEDKKENVWKEQCLKTYFYDPAANTWTDLKLNLNPPYRNCKYGLTYDEKNDVAILVGGQIGWNGPSCNDIWIFDVKKTEWKKMEPQYMPNEKEKLVLGESLMADYDSRHQVVILRSNSGFWAYRFKK